VTTEKTTPKTPKTTKAVRTTTGTPVDPYAETKPPKTTKTASKVDVEAAYRTGLQQFARGDTTGALASLRTSLAGNPNYAPTWRALGLVFEKLGEKDQARAAYKRYLQLAPSAGDAEQIRSRLERLR
jgi:Tfp pilus assembly protein PilF